MSTEIDTDRQPVTFEEAVLMLPPGERIHTFRNPGPGVMLGADWDREDVLDAIRKHGAELSGTLATKMKHHLYP